MFQFGKKKELYKEDLFSKDLVLELERVYKINENYDGLTTESPYMQGENEVVAWINKLLELKNSQIREQFLGNIDIMRFVTQMDSVKEMVDNISTQTESMEEIAASSEEMSHSIEEIANYVQASLTTTKEAISLSTESIETINGSFTYINQSFEEVQAVQDKMHNVVENTREIDNVVNIINEVAEQTNLLALNASIEAARSGDAGRGFAVVANEIKKLADNTKKSVNYIKDMVKKLRAEIGVSEQAITEAVTVFTKGKEHINQAVYSMDNLEGSLVDIATVFENISANVEEQTATTQEVTARLSEINYQTQELNEACMRTGQGIYNVSAMVQGLKQTALPYFKDVKGNQLIKIIQVEHLLWKWKAYNAVCGFVKLDDKNVEEHASCNTGRFLENMKRTNPADETVQNLYEPHKNVHTLSKEVIRAVNNGNMSNINNLLKELSESTDVFIERSKMIKI